MKEHAKRRKRTRQLAFLAALSFVWLVLRTGRRPSRITYPCQKAAASNVHLFLLVLLAPFLKARKLRVAWLPILAWRLVKPAIVLCLLLSAFALLTYPVNRLSVVRDGFSFQPVLTPQNALTSSPSSDLFFAGNASGYEGNMDAALATLVELMEENGLFFFNTTARSEGLIDKSDVIVIKVNCQWSQRGGTNTDLTKALVKAIVNHPEGFVGEIVIADNGQGLGSLDRSESNAFDHSQSMVDVANLFPSYNVSTFLWDTIGSKQVDEYDKGDFVSGYVVNYTANNGTHIYVSYPKFMTKFGTYVSFKNGIWSNSTLSYDSAKLKIVNVPVLKSHSDFGVTASVKHYMGVVSTALTNSHGSIRYGAMGTVMVETRMPTLNIIDAIWVNANPKEGESCGPRTPYAVASYANVIGASLDPVALEYWAAKNILIPAAIQKGYTDYSSLDPNYAPVTAGLMESYHNYLERSMDELKNAGHQATMNLTEMNVYVSAPSDNVPPEILSISRIPSEEYVQQGIAVKVNATVVDGSSGVKHVRLNYTHTNNSAAQTEIVDMQNLIGNVWNATIPSFLNGTNVTYLVIAEDYVGNNVTSEDLGYVCRYVVIPEYPMAAFSAFLMAITLLGVLVRRRKCLHRFKRT